MAGNRLHRGIRRLGLENYRSIQSAQVSLGPLTVFVGKNASGKSNILDAFRFLADCMRPPLDDTLARRGGFESLRFRASKNEPVSLSVSLRLPRSPASPVGEWEDYDADYTIRLAGLSGGEYYVQDEECIVRPVKLADGRVQFVRRDQEVASQGDQPITRAPDRRGLILPLLGGVRPWSLVYEALRAVVVYQIDPDSLKGLRERVPVSPRVALNPDGSNAADVLVALERDEPQSFDRLHAYLRTAIGQLDLAYGRSFGSKVAVMGRQLLGPRASPVDFDAQDLSEGTLRLLGVLLALYQPFRPFSLGIEEPEIAIHPLASGVVWDALSEASLSTQVLVTTHSPDVLDNKDVPAHVLRLVDWRGGSTAITALNRSSQRAIARHEFTAGELFRANALRGTGQ